MRPPNVPLSLVKVLSVAPFALSRIRSDRGERLPNSLTSKEYPPSTILESGCAAMQVKAQVGGKVPTVGVKLVSSVPSVFRRVTLRSGSPLKLEESRVKIT